jgi:integrase
MSATTTKRTGTLERCRDARGRVYFSGKIRLTDGSRPRIEIPEAKRFSENAARDFVAWAQEREDETHDFYNAKLAATTKREARIAGAAGETCDAWYLRFMAYRRGEVGSVDDDKWRWQKWISPHIGKKPIRDVTPDDIEDICDALTAAVKAYEAAGNMTGEGRLAPHTAANVWAALTTPMKYASTPKGPRDLRVRKDKGNPCLDIPPPRDGASKQRRWLRPDYFAKFIACKRLPREWREADAIGLYLHLRPGELHELRLKDLDLVAGEVRIARAYDERKKVVTTPKTEEGIRTVTIPATLMPLLERIALEGKADDRVCPVVAATPEKARAKMFREHLQCADVDDPSLFEETATHLPIDFRALRDSGITWRFLANERAEVVQREAGHEHISTTLDYAKEVENKGNRYGEPFPALPDDLLDPTPGAPVRRAVRQETKTLENSAEIVGEAGFEPAISSTQSLRTTGLCYSPIRRLLYHVSGAVAPAPRRGGPSAPIRQQNAAADPPPHQPRPPAAPRPLPPRGNRPRRPSSSMLGPPP